MIDRMVMFDYKNKRSYKREKKENLHRFIHNRITTYNINKRRTERHSCTLFIELTLYINIRLTVSRQPTSDDYICNQITMSVEC